MTAADDRATAYARRSAELDVQEAQHLADIAEDQIRDQRIHEAQHAARARRGRAAIKEVQLASLHESGHVVVALATGRVVVGALVDAGGSGVTWYLSGHGAGPPAHGGAIAERFAGQEGARLSDSDRAGAARGGHAMLDQFAAEDIVAENYAKVEELSEALIERGFVDDVLIKSIVGQPRLPVAEVV